MGISWVFPKTVKDAVISWRGSFVGRKRRKTWKLVPLCIFWTLWKERNRIVFKDRSVVVQKLKHSFNDAKEFQITIIENKAALPYP